MDTDIPKNTRAPRNVKELTVSEAIEKFRESFREENAAIEKLRAEGVLKRNRILLRVPEVVRDHVAAEGANQASEPHGLSDATASSLPDWTNEPPKGAPPTVIDRDERRVGKARTSG
jgi:hypothetical protein